MIDTRIAESEEGTTRKRSRLRIAVIAAAVAVLFAAGAAYWFLSGDAPPEVDLEATASAVTSTTSGAAVSTTAPAETAPTTAVPQPAASGIDGTWTVDTTVGEFTVTEQTTATFAGFRVDEVLNNVGATTAVGRTPQVSGTVVIDGTTVTTVDVTVDMTAMVSDRSRREGPIQRALGTESNPAATFVLTEPIELDEAAAAGDPVGAVATGDLTVNGVTNQIAIPIEAQLVDGSILVVGATDIVFADYNVTVPSASIVVSVEDQGVLELQLWLSR